MELAVIEWREYYWDEDTTLDNKGLKSPIRAHTEVWARHGLVLYRVAMSIHLVDHIDRRSNKIENLLVLDASMHATAWSDS